MPYKPEFDAEKFRELMLYVARQSGDDPSFSRTKLARILCYSDFLTFAYYGHAITGATYVRDPHGPLPQQMKQALADLVNHGDAIEFEPPYFTKRQKRLLPARGPKLELFSAAELAIVDQVIRDLRENHATGDGERSQCELLGWQIAGDHEEIPYSTIFLSDREPSDDDIRWAREFAREHGLPSPA